MGVGGEYPAEFTATGVPRRTRGRRLDELLQMLPALLRGAPRYKGKQAYQLGAPVSGTSSPPGAAARRAVAKPTVATTVSDAAAVTKATV